MRAFPTPAMPQTPGLQGELDVAGIGRVYAPAIVDVKTLDTSDTKARHER